MLLIAIRCGGRPAASRPSLLPPDHLKGHRDGALSVRMLLCRLRRQALALVNRCLGHGDLDVGADRDPEAIRLGHDELDDADLDTVRRLNAWVEPERSQPDDVKPCVRWRLIADVREASALEVYEYRACLAEGQCSTGV